MLRRIIISLLLLTWTALLHSAEAPDRLSEFLDGLDTLQADFDQVVVSTSRQGAVSKGTFYLSRPGRFRWSYSDPAGQQVIADGERVWLYDVDLAQVSHQSQDDALRGTPALLLSDTAPIEEHFEVIGLSGKAGLDWVELIPRSDNSEITKVLIAFNGDHLQQLEMIDSFGQVTRFRFRNIQRNPELPQDLFRFVPPPDVDILGQ